MYFDKDALVLQYLKDKDPIIRSKIVFAYQPLVEYIAKKMAYHSDDYEDLIQIGSIGLLKSLDRYRTSANADFSTFATPNIIGEIKHYFRDKGNLVKVPRRLQELYTKIREYIKTISQDHPSPTIRQIADHFDISEEEVLEAMEANQSTKTISLDATSHHDDTHDDTAVSLVNSLGISANDEHILNEESIATALNCLGERERKIIILRFFDGLTQREISQQMELSQMHVSRLLAFSLKVLKKNLGF